MDQTPLEGQADADAPKGQAGDYYSELIQEQLNEERARKASLEGRALAVVPISGLLATVLLAVASPTFGETNHTTHLAIVRWGTMIAFVLFLLAIIFALIANRLKGYDEPKLAYLRHLRDKVDWSDSPDVGRKVLVDARLGVLKDARCRNSKKAQWVSRALLCEMVAVIAVAVTGICYLISL